MEIFNYAVYFRLCDFTFECRSLLLFIIWEISCSFHPHGKTNLVYHSSSDFKSFNCVFKDFTTEFYLRMLHYFADNFLFRHIKQRWSTTSVRGCFSLYTNVFYVKILDPFGAIRNIAVFTDCITCHYEKPSAVVHFNFSVASSARRE